MFRDKKPKSKQILLTLFVGVSVCAFLRLFFFIQTYAVDIFYLDEWDYLTNIFFYDGFDLGFLTRLGPHRFGLGFPIYYMLLHFFDFDARSISYMVLAFVVLNLFLYLKLLKRVSCKPLLITDVFIPLLFFNISQHAIFLSNPNITLHQLCYTLILAFGLFLTSRHWVRYFWLMAVVLLLTAVTGNGFLVVVALIPFLLWQFISSADVKLKWRWALLTGLSVIATVLYIVFAQYKSLKCAFPTIENTGEILLFLKKMMLRQILAGHHTLSWLLFITLTIAFLALAYHQLFKAKSITLAQRQVPLIYITYFLIFVATALLGRWCYKIGIASSSRYLPQLTFAFLFMYSFAFIQQYKWMRYGFGVVMLCWFFITEYHFEKYERQAIVEETYKNLKAWKKCYCEEASVETCNNQTGFNIYPRPKKTKLELKLNQIEEFNSSFCKEY